MPADARLAYATAMNAPTKASQATSRIVTRVRRRRSTAVPERSACRQRSRRARPHPRLRCAARTRSHSEPFECELNAAGSGFGTPASADVTTASKVLEQPQPVQSLGEGAVPVRDDSELQAVRPRPRAPRQRPSPVGRRERRGTRRRTPEARASLPARGGRCRPRRETLRAWPRRARCERAGGSGPPPPRTRRLPRVAAGRRLAPRARQRAAAPDPRARRAFRSRRPSRRRAQRNASG